MKQERPDGIGPNRVSLPDTGPARNVRTCPGVLCSVTSCYRCEGTLCLLRN